MEHNFTLTRKNSLSFTLKSVVISGGGFLLLFMLSRYSFLLAHVFAEMFSVAVAWIIFFIAWNGHRYFEHSYFSFLGIAYFFIGTLDLVHTIAYEGMGVFTGYTANLATELWISARFIESGALLLALILLQKKMSVYAILTGWIAVFSIFLLLVFSGLFPDCYIPGEGLTTFKKGSELAITALLALTLVLLYKRRRFFSNKIIGYLYGSIVLTILAEFSFIAYIGVYDLSNLIGHYFKIASFYLMYRGVVVTTFKDPFEILMQRLQERNRELESQRREIDRAKRISETMLDNIPEEIALLDRETLKIIDVNQTFIDVHGVSKDQVIGGYCYKITHGIDEVCSTDNHPCPLYAKVNEQPLVHTHTAKNGEKRFVEVSVWPVYDNNGSETNELVHIARDITPQKRIEQLRNDVERVVRHDLKSPLNGIIGGAQLLLDYGSCTEEQRTLIETIYSSGLSVLNMIDNSMDLYKMEEGLYKIERSWFDLASTFRRLSGRWVTIRNSKKIEILFYINGEELNSKSEFKVYAEEQTIENLLANLTENALDASPMKTIVTVNVEGLGSDEEYGEKSEKSEKSGFLLDVHNYGSIPPEIRDRFFERYVTRGKDHGTGLGTYSAFLITRAHGGRIWFTSEEDEGTHLLVEIPS